MPEAAAAGAAEFDADMHAGEDSGEEKEYQEPLDWEEAREALPGDLERVLARQVSGTLQVDLRQLFDSLPRFAGIKDRPEVNNHRQDSQSKMDRTLRGVQQRVLSLLRMYPVIHSELAQEKVLLGQQFFLLATPT